MDPQLLSRLKHCSTLPSPPGIAVQILEIAENPRATLTELEDIIHLDPALTSKILRVANSPIYRQRRTLTSLRQALMALGLRATMMLALGFSLIHDLTGESEEGIDHTRFWRRSFLAATAGQMLGLHLKRSDAEEIFLAALLQDIGMLALERIQPGFYLEAGAHQLKHLDLVRYETEHCHTDHSQVGAWLLGNWNFPERIRHAIETSHAETPTANDRDLDDFTRCIALSGPLADYWLEDDEPATRFDTLRSRTRALLNIDEATLPDMLDSMRTNIRDTEHVFETTLVDGHEADLLLSHAHDLSTVLQAHTEQETHRLQRVTKSLKSQTAELEELGRRDPLTGLYNRNFLDEFLSEEFVRAKKYGRSLSVAFADVDHFKRINDEHGHQVGDQILCTIATLLRNVLRESDVVVRYGGEEFVIILPDTPPSAAAEIAERIIKTFRQTSHPVGHSHTVATTISIGLATQWPQGGFDSVEQLVNAADQAVYLAKTQGRDRVVVYALE
ncbi:MAG: GGDEF domain-containing protein [Gammaproteobacteria bacterium]|jgi:diguanylate cyclase (GGDEF)-like protein